MKHGTSSLISEGYVGNGTGGKPAPGIYPSNALGQKKYNKTGVNEYSDVTFDSTYNIYYYEVDSEGTKHATQLLTGSPFTLSLGQNVAIPIVSAYGNPTVNVVMYLADTITIDATRDGDFTFLQSDIGDTSKISGTISGGGAWNDTLPSALTLERIDTTYTGSFTPPEGDYSHVYTQIDPNGVETSSTAVTIRWAPHTFLKTIDSNANMRDAQPDVSGIESFNVEYVKGYNVLTDGNVPQYDVNGELQTLDGGQDLLVSYGVDPSQNNIQVDNVDDDFGNVKNTDTKVVIRIPDVQYTGPTTFSEEADGRIVTVVNGLLVDQGLANESNQNVTFDFTGDDYGAVNKPACYSYPTGEQGCVTGGVNLTYNELAVQSLTDHTLDALSNRYNFRTVENNIISDLQGSNDIDVRGTSEIGYSSSLVYGSLPSEIFENEEWGDCKSLNGSTYLEVRNSTGYMPRESEFSYGLWFKASSNTGYMIGHNTFNGTAPRNSFFLFNGNLSWSLWNGSFTQGPNVNDGEWHYLQFKNYNDGTWKSQIKLDNVIITSDASRGNEDNTLFNIFIGARANGDDPQNPNPATFMTGEVGRFDYYTKTLSDDEEKSLYYRNKYKYLRLVHGDSNSYSNDGRLSKFEFNSAEFQRLTRGAGYDIQTVNIADRGDTSYNILEVKKKAPWLLPDPDDIRQGIESGWNCVAGAKFKPDMVHLWYSSNDASRFSKDPYTVPNTSGFNTKADEVIWVQDDVEAYYVTQLPGIVVTRTGVGPRYDSASGGTLLRDDLKDMNTAIKANVPDYYNVYDELAEANGEIKPEYDYGDQIHYIRLAQARVITPSIYSGDSANIASSSGIQIPIPVTPSVNGWVCDSISGGLISSNPSGNEVSTVGRDLLVDGYWDLDGSTDSGRISNSSSLLPWGSEWGVTMRLKDQIAQTGWIFAKAKNTLSQRVGIYCDQNGGIGLVENGSIKTPFPVLSNESTGKWSSIAWTHRIIEGDHYFYLYIDGVCVYVSDVLNVFDLSDWDIHIGSRYTSDDQDTGGLTTFGSGGIGDIKYYNGLPSYSDIMNDYINVRDN